MMYLCRFQANYWILSKSKTVPALVHFLIYKLMVLTVDRGFDLSLHQKTLIIITRKLWKH